MCLHTRQVKPKVFTKDRVFYKTLVTITDIFGTTYQTPYQNTLVPIGKTIRAKGKKDFYHEDAAPYGKYNCLFGGYIHLYKSKKAALDLADKLYCDKVVVKAIVKKGTEYYSGCDDDGRRSVAVKEVKYELI